MTKRIRTILVVLPDEAGRRIGTRGGGRYDVYNMIGNVGAESDA